MSGDTQASDLAAIRELLEKQERDKEKKQSDEELHTYNTTTAVPGLTSVTAKWMFYWLPTMMIVGARRSFQILALSRRSDATPALLS
jgi:hypothetical protein